MKTTVTSLVPALLALFLLTAPAHASSLVTLTSDGTGTFLLTGEGMEKAAGFEFTISYDTATLTNPRVQEGPIIAGAMTAINPRMPGAVRIVAIRMNPGKGSGLIAALNFDRKGNRPGRIKTLKAKLLDIKGTPLKTRVRILPRPDALAREPKSLPEGMKTPEKR